MPNDLKTEEFTLIWKIKNFSMCAEVKGACLQSPYFKGNDFGNTRWLLKLLPKGETDETFIVCKLMRSTHCNGPDAVVRVSFILTIDATEVSFRKSTELSSYSFKKGGAISFDICKKEDIFEKKDVYLPNDTLTVRCNMLKDNKDIVVLKYPGISNSVSSPLAEEMYAAINNFQLRSSKKIFNPFQCVARTLIHVERSTDHWYIERFSALRLGQRMSIPIVSTCFSIPSLIVTFYLRYKTKEDEYIQIEIRRMDLNAEKSFFVKCNITVLDTENKFKNSAEDSFFFPVSGNDVWVFPIFIKKSDLLAERSIFLKEDVLALRFGFAISVQGEFSSYITESTRDCPDFLREIRKINYSSSTKRKLELQRSCNPKKFCDITFQAEDQTFNAHKVILANKSPVLCAMFEANMKEKDINVVDIPDLDAETLNRMLTYMYTETLENLEWENAKKLYFAADKYQVRPLKEELSSFLLSNLTVANVCEALELADLHQDKDLENSILIFVCCNAAKIFRSDVWTNFMLNRVKLASEIMHRVCILKLDS